MCILLAHLSWMCLVLVVTLIWVQTQGPSTTLIRLVLVVLAISSIFHHHATWPGILVVGVSTTFANSTSVRISTILKCYKNYQSKMCRVNGCQIFSLSYCYITRCVYLTMDNTTQEDMNDSQTKLPLG